MSTSDLISGGNIEPRGLEEEMRSSYLDYAMSVIVGRALPDVRDGIQSELVHRVQDAALHRLLAVAYVRQGAALDHGDGVIQVGAFGESRKGQRFAAIITAASATARWLLRGWVVKEVCLCGHRFEVLVTWY